MVDEKIFPREKLHESLGRLFSFLDYDQWMEMLDYTGGSDDYEYEDDEVIIEALADRYTENLCPNIYDYFKEDIPVLTTYIKDMAPDPLVLFYIPAVKIYETIECADSDGEADVLDRDQVYLLADGDIVLVKSIRMGHGNICSEYKTEIGTITDSEDFCFDENDLFSRLSDIWEGYHDEEDD
ncbi:MAG: hypothetical protein J6O61_14340 [Butyrivibrio sp.]|uniref:hypothetical protein n=1 Tax=Butyrivibrio sp. TaxID=28121 RepID=UPI001B28099F|nr:hypothetical protein [Butyrivibrio sp.]MBO6241980.1 hypothetical protein [Butyrivibrio sp.]